MICSAAPPSRPGLIPFRRKTPGWPPETARRKSAPSQPRFWRDAACNQKPAGPPATPRPQPRNIRPAPARNFRADNNARRQRQKSPRRAKAISLEFWPRRFVVGDSLREEYHLSPTRAYPYWSVLIRGKVLAFSVPPRSRGGFFAFDFRRSLAISWSPTSPVLACWGGSSAILAILHGADKNTSLAFRFCGTT